MRKQSKESPKQTDNATGTKKYASAAAPTTPTKSKGPPFDISLQEYKDLCDQVADLSLEELQEEWVLAARYGDLDVVYAIKSSEKFGDGDSSLIVNCQDSSNGNTALHMAAANGHLSVVEALLDCGSSLQHSVTNHAGNTPLHWAAANGHDRVVKILLQRIEDIDVLKKNEFGRSALTEGFTSQKTEVIKHLLEHDSAAEEKLLQGGEEIDEPEGEDHDDGGATPTTKGKENTSNDKKSTNATDTDNTKSTTTAKNKNNEKQNIERPKNGEEGIIHSFQFLLPESSLFEKKYDNNSDNNENFNADENGDQGKKPPPPMKIRELPIPLNEDCFGDKPEEDTTGYGIWAASLVMARWMAASRERFRGKGLLELGAGCGVPGLAAAYYSEAKQVYLTDVNPKTIENLKYNIQLNNELQDGTSPSSSGTTTSSWEDRLNAGPINWEDPTTWPKEKIDYIIGSDLIYQESIVPILKKVVLGLCQGHGTFLYVAPDTDSDIGRDGLAEFIHAMKEIEGCNLVSDDLAPRLYHLNPLASQDDDMCFLHFHELTSATYRLYEFQINVPTTK